MTIEDLLIAYKKAEGVIEEMEAQKEVVKNQILEELNRKQVTGLKTSNGYYVSRAVRSIYSSVLMSTAKELGAVKMIEKIDSQKLKKLEDKGVEIKGSKKIVYLLVKEI